MHDEHDAETSALLDQLGALAREQLSTREPEWEEFARGELAEHELRAASDDDDDDFERSLELFRPLDDDARERMTAALLSATGGASQAPAPVIALPSRPRPRWRRVAATVLPLAAAAALVIWVGQRPPETGSRVAGLGLPSYQIEVRGGVQRERGPRPAPGVDGHRYTPSSEFEVVLRPATDARGPVRARVFAFPEALSGAPQETGSKGQVIPVTMQASESGSLRMAGPTRELLPLAPGRWRLVFAIGREDRLPTDPERVRSLAAHEEHDGLWIEEYRVELTGD